MTDDGSDRESKAARIGKLLTRHTLPHVPRDKVPREYWVLVAVLKCAISDATAKRATGAKQSKSLAIEERLAQRDAIRFLYDWRGAAYVSALGISPTWFRAVLTIAGIKPPRARK